MSYKFRSSNSSRYDSPRGRRYPSPSPSRDNSYGFQGQTQPAGGPRFGSSREQSRSRYRSPSPFRTRFPSPPLRKSAYSKEEEEPYSPRRGRSPPPTRGYRYSSPPRRRRRSPSPVRRFRSPSPTPRERESSHDYSSPDAQNTNSHPNAGDRHGPYKVSNEDMKEYVRMMEKLVAGGMEKTRAVKIIDEEIAKVMREGGKSSARSQSPPRLNQSRAYSPPQAQQAESSRRSGVNREELVERLMRQGISMEEAMRIVDKEIENDRHYYRSPYSPPPSRRGRSEDRDRYGGSRRDDDEY